MFPIVPLAFLPLHYFFGITMTVISVFLILLVLVQRGRGGGLAGAFGGMGGQSAFGTKAGDTFTRVTIVASVAWILLCIASVKLLSYTGDELVSQPGRVPSSSGLGPAGDGTTDGATSPGGTGTTGAMPDAETPGLENLEIDTSESLEPTDSSDPVEVTTEVEVAPVEGAGTADESP